MTYISTTLLDFATRAYANHDAAHNLLHALKVYSGACTIAAKEGISMTDNEAAIFPYVMIGHDFRDHTLIGSSLSEEEIHKFYVDEVGEANARLIEHIHANCSWSKRKSSIESPIDWMRKVLQDADWLEAIGDEGLDRCIDYTKTINGNIPADVCAHIREKLLLIPAELNFETSKKMADVDPLIQYLMQNE